MRVAFVQVREGCGPVGLGRHRDWLARQRRRWRWRCGVAGMRVGGRRTLLIPSGYGYGRRGAGGVIPPNASLVFEVELLDVKPH